MDIVTSLPAAGAAGAVAAVVMKSPELLKEIYGDLGKPGVAQVGQAIGTILGLGNTILIPLRLLNEAGRAFEKRSFEQIAERFKYIPPDEVITPPPEISVPIIEKLSYTQDQTLREMFIELLAKASTSDKAIQVHPSFAQVLSSMAPEEATLIQEFRSKNNIPLISIELGYEGKGRGSAVLHDLIFKPSRKISNANNIPLFLSNMAGLGIIEILRDTHLTAKDTYEATEQYAKNLHSLPEYYMINNEKRPIIYKRFLCRVSPYGARMITACTREGQE